MAQTIKDIQKQIDAADIDGFVAKAYKKGDYGYNLIYGMLDDNIEVAFKVYYRTKRDEALNDLDDSLKRNIFIVRYIRENLIPKDCVLVKFIDGEHLRSFQIGVAINGQTIEFPMSWVYWKKNHPANMPPIYYSTEQMSKNIKKSVSNYAHNFKILLNSADFKYESHSVVDAANDLKKRTLDVKINGSVRGINTSFIVQDFEHANVKNVLQKHIKTLKSTSMDEA